MMTLEELKRIIESRDEIRQSLSAYIKANRSVFPLTVLKNLTASDVEPHTGSINTTIAQCHDLSMLRALSLDRSLADKHPTWHTLIKHQFQKQVQALIRQPDQIKDQLKDPITNENRDFLIQLNRIITQKNKLFPTQGSGYPQALKEPLQRYIAALKSHLEKMTQASIPDMDVEQWWSDPNQIHRDHEAIRQILSDEDKVKPNDRGHAIYLFRWRLHLAENDLYSNHSVKKEIEQFQQDHKEFNPVADLNRTIEQTLADFPDVIKSLQTVESTEPVVNMTRDEKSHDRSTSLFNSMWHDIPEKFSGNPYVRRIASGQMIKKNSIMDHFNNLFLRSSRKDMIHRLHQAFSQSDPKQALQVVWSIQIELSREQITRSYRDGFSRTQTHSDLADLCAHFQQQLRVTSHNPAMSLAQLYQQQFGLTDLIQHAILPKDTLKKKFSDQLKTELLAKRIIPTDFSEQHLTKLAEAWLNFMRSNQEHIGINQLKLKKTIQELLSATPGHSRWDRYLHSLVAEMDMIHNPHLIPTPIHPVGSPVTDGDLLDAEWVQIQQKEPPDFYDAFLAQWRDHHLSSEQLDTILNHYDRLNLTSKIHINQQIELCDDITLLQAHMQQLEKSTAHGQLYGFLEDRVKVLSNQSTLWGHPIHHQHFFIEEKPSSSSIILKRLGGRKKASNFSLQAIIHSLPSPSDQSLWSYISKSQSLPWMMNGRLKQLIRLLQSALESHDVDQCQRTIADVMCQIATQIQNKPKQTMLF